MISSTTKFSILGKDIELPVIRVLIMLTLIGAFIRFFNLTFVGLWLDEIYSMLGSDPSTTISDVYEYAKQDQPPFFFTLLHGWLGIFGYSDYSGRSFVAVVGTLGIPCIYFLGREFKGEKLGLTAAFLTTFNWFHTDISKEIRFYPLVFLLSTLSFLFFVRCFKYKRLQDSVLYVIVTALLLNTHYYGMVVFVAQFFIFLILYIFYERSFRYFIIGLSSGILTGLSFAHWLPVIFHDMQISSFHVVPVEWSFPFSYLWSYIKEPFTFGVAVISIAWATRIFLVKSKNDRISPGHAIVIGWLIICYLIPVLYSVLRMPLMTPKYETISVPAILLIIAYGFSELPLKKYYPAVVTLLVISATIILFFARPPYRPRRAEDWREVAAYFADHRDKAKPVFSQLGWFHQYYFKKQALPEPMDQNLVDFKSIVSQADEICLLKNSRYTGGYAISNFLPDQQQLVNEQFHIVDSVSFKQTTAIFYKRNE